MKVKYQSTLYDSRCIIFGVNAPNCPEFSTPSNFKSRDVYYSSDNDPNPSIEMHLNDFLSSMFWVLDAKRLEKSKEKVFILNIFYLITIRNLFNFFSWIKLLY